jgi:hypothetical protein
MIKKALIGDIGNFTRSFVVEIQSGSQELRKMNRFAVHHSIQKYPNDEKLRVWTKAEAMVPWVAVAAELPVSPIVGRGLAAILIVK